MGCFLDGHQPPHGLLMFYSVFYDLSLKPDYSRVGVLDLTTCLVYSPVDALQQLAHHPQLLLEIVVLVIYLKELLLKLLQFISKLLRPNRFSTNLPVKGGK